MRKVTDKRQTTDQTTRTDKFRYHIKLERGLVRLPYTHTLTNTSDSYKLTQYLFLHICITSRRVTVLLSRIICTGSPEFSKTYHDNKYIGR